MIQKFEKILSGGDLRSLGKSNSIILKIKNQKDKELKWHLALLMPRVILNNKETVMAWNILTNWAKDKDNSKIVRVNSIQGLFEIMNRRNDLINNFNLTLLELEKENIPAIRARINKIRKIISSYEPVIIQP